MAHALEVKLKGMCLSYWDNNDDENHFTPPLLGATIASSPCGRWLVDKTPCLCWRTARGCFYLG